MANSGIVSSFYKDFEKFMKNELGAKKLKKYFSKESNLSLSGTEGLVSTGFGEVNQPIQSDGTQTASAPLSYPGVDSGRDYLLQALEAFRSDIKTNNIKTRHLIGGGVGQVTNDPFGSLGGTPFWESPQYVDNKVVVLSDHYATSKKTGEKFRLDVGNFFTLNKQGKITDLEMTFDSYVMSQAMSGADKLISNPNMDTAMEGEIDSSISIADTESGTYNFFNTFASAIPPNPDNLDVLTGVLTDDVKIKFQGDPKYQISARNKIRSGKGKYLKVQKDSWIQSISEIFTMDELYASNGVSVAKYTEQRISGGPGFEKATGRKPLGRRFTMPASITTYIANTDSGFKVSGTEGLFDTTPIVTSTYGSNPFPMAPSNYYGPMG